MNGTHSLILQNLQKWHPISFAHVSFICHFYGISKKWELPIPNKGQYIYSNHFTSPTQFGLIGINILHHIVLLSHEVDNITHNSCWCSGSVLSAPFQLACNPWSSWGSPSLYSLWNHPCLYQILQKPHAALKNIQTQNWESHVTKPKKKKKKDYTAL